METRDAPKLKRVTRIDSIPAGSTSFDEQGFLHDTPVVTSTGIFEYALPDGGVRRELRLPEHVFDKKSLASYSGKPVIITHEAGSIDKNNVMDEIVGTILSEGFRDGEDVRCKIVIHDIDKVKKLPYRELSLGYSLDLVEEPGEWNGEKYDAIQTNIRINHLAIVDSARAGEQAHLNLDGKKVVLDDKKIPKGGSNKMENVTRKDSVAMTPEELVEAINAYKASGASKEKEVPEPKEPEKEEPVVTPAPGELPEHEEVTEPEEKKDSNVGPLIEAVKELLEALEGEHEGEPAGTGMETDSTDGGPGFGPKGEGCKEDNEDSSNDQSGSLNNDSADDVFRQRLSICRMGDKLHMDGLEEKSILDAKKAIIGKVFPDMRLDGKDTAYVNAAYDLAVNEASKRKDVNYQRQQMNGNPPSQQRMDGNTESSMAASARQRMIEREGGNE